jgi:hypothetical protein
MIRCALSVVDRTCSTMPFSDTQQQQVGVVMLPEYQQHNSFDSIGRIDPLLHNARGAVCMYCLQWSSYCSTCVMQTTSTQAVHGLIGLGNAPGGRARDALGHGMVLSGCVLHPLYELHKCIFTGIALYMEWSTCILPLLREITFALQKCVGA